MKKVIFIGILALLCVWQMGWGQIPKTISYQGVLTDLGGVPVPDSTYSITFRLYAVSTGGSFIWQESQSVEVKKGVFNVILGKTTPFDSLKFAKPYWLGITVAPDPEMIPRVELTSAPYSLNSLGGGGGSGGNGWTDDGTVVRLNTSSDRVGIGTTNPSAQLEVKTNRRHAGYFTSDSTSDSTEVVHAEFTGTGSENVVAVYGKSTPAEDRGYGGYFIGGEYGVHGEATPSSLSACYGVYGDVQGDGAWKYGVSGETSGSGENYGVHGFASGNENAVFNYGIYGAATGGYTGSATNYGVYGKAWGAGTNWAGYFDGDLFTKGFKMPTGAGAGKVLTSDANGVGTWQPASGGGIGGSGTTNYLPKFTGSTTLGNSGIYQNANSIGIGTASPASNRMLSVVASGGANTALFADGGSGMGLLCQGSSSTDPALWAVNNSGIAGLFSGQVSVGVFPPNTNAKLHVVNDRQFAGYFTSNYLADNTHVIHAEFNGSGGNNDPVAVYGKSIPIDSRGIGGHFEGGYHGVEGLVSSTGNGSHYGVLGQAVGGTGTNTGVFGDAFINSNHDGDKVYGVRGRANLYGSGSNKVAYGVHGSVFGSATATLWAGYFDGKTYVRDTLCIGTEHPETALHVNGEITIQNDPSTTSFISGSGFPKIYNSSAGGSYPFSANGNLIIQPRTSAYTDIVFATGYGTPSSRMVIKDNGNVGIGNYPSPGNILTIQQNSSTDPIADAWTTYSSRRWKTNIKTIENPLDKVKRLRGVTYDWKANGKHDIGLIAEEVGEVIPEVVAYEENGVDAKSVDYARLVAVLIEAVKAQQKEIDELKKEMKRFSSRPVERESNNLSAKVK